MIRVGKEYGLEINKEKSKVLVYNTKTKYDEIGGIAVCNFAYNQDNPRIGLLSESENSYLLFLIHSYFQYFYSCLLSSQRYYVDILCQVI